MQIKEILKWGSGQLSKTSSSARLDAELLLSDIIKKPTSFLLSHDDSEIGFFAGLRFRSAIRKRKNGMPVAYIVGHREFYFLEFEVNRHVLVPRPDTEILVECVINYIKGLSPKGATLWDYGLSKIQLLDVGTGSGCIPVSVCKNVEGLNAVAVDISAKALSVARRNIKKHGMTGRIQLIKSDLLKNVPLNFFEGMEVIVTANLPYIPDLMKISKDLTYEPKIALFGGDDGMELYKKIVHQISDIRPKAFFFELFEHQIAILQAHMPGYRLKFVKNMTGEARVMMMEREG